MVESLCFTITLQMIGRGSGTYHFIRLLQAAKQLVLKLSSLIMQNTSWKSESKHEIIVEPVARTAQQVFEWGAKEECVKEIFFGRGGGHACGFLFNLSKVTENAIITIKLLIFLHIFSDVANGSENSPSLN